jgi:hypothetical protein
VILAILVIGGIVSIFDHGGSAQPSTTDDYSTVAPTPTYDMPTYDSLTTVPAAPTEGYTGGGSTGSGGVDIDPPGHGYIDGPGVDCHLSGCYVDGPHVGWRW